MLFYIVPNLMHVTSLLKFIGADCILEKNSYLIQHTSYSETYQYLYFFHKLMGTVWIILGGLQHFCGVTHTLFGYLYILSGILNPLFGIIMLTYRPNIVGGIITYVILIITLLRTYWVLFFLLYYLKKGNIKEHRKYAFRSWYIALASIQTASLTSIVASLGIIINPYNYRVILITTSIISLLVTEVICSLL